jgi:hypothetical protein
MLGFETMFLSTVNKYKESKVCKNSKKYIYLDNICIPKWSIYKFPPFLFSEAITGSETLATETGS